MELLSGIMVVTKEGGRVNMARQAAARFLRNAYPRKELVVVNSSGEPVATANHPQVVEIRPKEPKATIGAHYNEAIDAASGHWIAKIDDDDYSHPFRFLYQAATADPETVNLLAAQVRVSLVRVEGDKPRNFASLYVDAGGIPNTMFFRKGLGIRFPPLDAGEDFGAVIGGGLRRSVTDNSTGLLAALSIAFHHGGNRTPESAFFGLPEGTLQPRRWLLQPEAATGLRQALEDMGAIRSGAGS